MIVQPFFATKKVAIMSLYDETQRCSLRPEAKEKKQQPIFRPLPSQRLREPGIAFDNRRVARAPASATGLSQRFWHAWVEHREYLTQLAFRWMSGNRSDAEDVVSRAAIKAHDRYLRDANRIRNLRSWLARLLHNICMDEHRKRQVRHRLLHQFHPEQLEYLALTANAPRPEFELENGESMSAAMAAIFELPPRLRHPFVLRFVFQYSNQEIARHLDLSEVNVRKRIQLGRSYVRQRLMH